MKTAKFKDSELGPIPEDWEVKRLGGLFSFLAAGDLQSGYSSKERTFENVWPIFSNSLPNRGLYGYTSRPRYKCGSMTITGRGTLGHAEYRESDFDAIIRLIVMEPHHGVDSRFFVSYINTFDPFPISVSSIPQLTVPQVQCVKVPFPPLPEQRRIAEALGAVDRLIDSLDELIAKKRRIAQGLALDLLGMRNVNSDYSDKPANAGKMKDTRTLVSASDKSEFQKSGERNEPIRRLPGFTGEWGVILLGEVGMWLKGQPLSKAQITVHGERECIHYGELFTKYGPVIDSPISHTNCEAIVVSKSGDVLFPSSDVTPEGLGRCSAILKDGVVLGGDMIVLRPTIPISSEFLSYMINFNKSKIIAKVTGITVRHITGKTLSSFGIKIPPTLAEQRAIAEVLAAADAEIAALEAKKRKYAQIKAGMMRDLLTGRVRMKGE